MLRNNGSEKTILSVNKVNASTGVSANAFFTMMALVENKTAPKKVNTNPGNVIFDFWIIAFIQADGQLSVITLQHCERLVSCKKLGSCHHRGNKVLEPTVSDK